MAFIDIQVFSGINGIIIKELCILSAKEIFTPIHEIFLPTEKWHHLSLRSKQINMYFTLYGHTLHWDEGNRIFCDKCIRNAISSHEVYYTQNEAKKKTLQSLFPTLKVTEFNGNLPEMPNNIHCPWRDHGPDCAYENCIRMCSSYLNKC